MRNTSLTDRLLVQCAGTLLDGFARLAGGARDVATDLATRLRPDPAAQGAAPADTGAQTGAAQAGASQSAVYAPLPGLSDPAAAELTSRERRHAAGLMRVNHVGEVCAQALYRGHALASRNPAQRAFFLEVAGEEAEHLDWTRQRLNQLQARPSALVPLWYAGALGMGVLAACRGERHALGFMSETERQVEKHLASHLDQLPERDTISRAVVARMMDDEVRHAETAERRGALRPPLPIRFAMRGMAKVMTTVAYRV